MLFPKLAMCDLEISQSQCDIGVLSGGKDIFVPVISAAPTPFSYFCQLSVQFPLTVVPQGECVRTEDYFPVHSIS